MKRTIKHVAPWLAAAAISGALAFAPVAGAAAGDVAPTPTPSPNATPSQSGADPDAPFGADAPGDEVPYDPYIKNPGGGVDVPS